MTTAKLRLANHQAAAVIDHVGRLAPFHVNFRDACNPGYKDKNEGSPEDAVATCRQAGAKSFFEIRSGEIQKGVSIVAEGFSEVARYFPTGTLVLYGQGKAVAYLNFEFITHASELIEFDIPFLFVDPRCRRNNYFSQMLKCVLAALLVVGAHEDRRVQLAMRQIFNPNLERWLRMAGFQEVAPKPSGEIFDFPLPHLAMTYPPGDIKILLEKP